MIGEGTHFRIPFIQVRLPVLDHMPSRSVRECAVHTMACHLQLLNNNGVRDVCCSYHTMVCATVDATTYHTICSTMPGTADLLTCGCLLMCACASVCIV